MRWPRSSTALAFTTRRSGSCRRSPAAAGGGGRPKLRAAVRLLLLGCNRTGLVLARWLLRAAGACWWLGARHHRLRPALPHRCLPAHAERLPIHAGQAARAGRPAAEAAGRPSLCSVLCGLADYLPQQHWSAAGRGAARASWYTGTRPLPTCKTESGPTRWPSPRRCSAATAAAPTRPMASAPPTARPTTSTSCCGSRVGGELRLPCSSLSRCAAAAWLHAVCSRGRVGPTAPPPSAPGAAAEHRCPRGTFAPSSGLFPSGTVRQPPAVARTLPKPVALRCHFSTFRARQACAGSACCDLLCLLPRGMPFLPAAVWHRGWAWRQVLQDWEVVVVLSGW